MAEKRDSEQNQKLEDLAVTALEGFANADEVQALEELLLGSEKDRERFLEFAAFECALEEAMNEGASDSAPVVCSSKEASAWRESTKKTRGIWYARSLQAFILATSLAVVLVFLLNWEIGSNQGSFGTGTVPPPNGFAVVASQADVDWETSAVSSGDVLPRGVHHLRSGVVHLELFSGVQLVVEGEAKFGIESPLVVTLNKGAVRAYVPDVAHGFRVVTRAGKIVDYGTEFSVRVDGDTTDFTVLDGEVGLLQDKGPEIRFVRGDSLRVRNALAKPEVLENPIRVMSSSTASREALQSLSIQGARWETSLQEWLRDPRLVACYRGPSEKQSRVLENLADGGATATQAAVVGATACVNRWGQEGRAFDYTRFGSRSRVSLPETMHDISLVCWVKINSLSNLYNSLFLTDGHEEGEPHWQILRDGRIFFSVKHPHRKGTSWRQTVFYSPSIWRDEMSGDWNMLAVTYDRKANKVAHYFNGKQVSLEPIPEHARVSGINIRAASIANWAEPNPSYRTDEEFTCRNLNGAVDEVFIFDGALNANEISEIYSQSSGGE